MRFKFHLTTTLQDSSSIEDLKLLLGSPNAKSSVSAFFSSKIEQCIEDISKFSEISSLFNQLVLQYRVAIGRVGGESKKTVKTEELERSTAGVGTVFTEVDMVELVFLPLMGTKQKLDEWVESVCRESRLELISCDIFSCYFQVLLEHQIYPHKKAQNFLFGISISRVNLLRQLIQFHVLLDSFDIVRFLLILSRKQKWAFQAALDMAFRLGDLSEIASILLESITNHSIPLFLSTLRNWKRNFRLSDFLQTQQTIMKEDQFDKLIDEIVDVLHFGNHPIDVKDCDKWIDLVTW